MAIALGEGGADHFAGLTRAAQEMLGIKLGIELAGYWSVHRPGPCRHRQTT